MLGFNAGTIGYLEDHGISTAMAFFRIPLSQFDTMIKNINQHAMFPPPGAAGGVVMFSYISVVGMKAFRAWLDYWNTRGQDLNPNEFGIGNLTRWTNRLDDLTRFVKNKDYKPVDSPGKLATFKDWKAWEELFLTYLRQFRGSVSGVPLSYLVRMHFMQPLKCCFTFIIQLMRI
jgi:hypothetical protein